jgi:hypothetical protein
MNVHVHPAKVIYVIEGNVFEIVADLDFYIHFRERVRLEGLDLPNLRSGLESDRIIARNAKDCAMRLLLQRDVTIESFRENANHVRWSVNMYIPEVSTRFEASRVTLQGINYIDVCKYMRCLSDHRYNPSEVDLPKPTGGRVESRS